MLTIGIVGNGFVGKATRLLENCETQFLIYDLRPEFCCPPGITLNHLSKCDLIFISVPTPMQTNGKCHLNIVESVINDLNKIIDHTKTFIVIRSTVLPGTSDKLNCYFMPEFLTEKNYVDDFINCQEWIFGLLSDQEQNKNYIKKITELFQIAFNYGKIKYNKLNFCSNMEAETIKYFRNCFLATKVSFCNEMEEFCKHKGIEYENVRSLAILDPRVGASHSCVPGHDGLRGFGGTCFPKDTSALLYEMNTIGMNSYILKSVVERNQNVDRPSKDWNSNKGRCVIDDVK